VNAPALAPTDAQPIAADQANATTSTTAPRLANISVIILTRNEACNIAECIRSVAWSDDIVVFDSFSTDETVTLALAAGARVIQHAFASYSQQREASLRESGLINPWVLMLDADERIEPALATEMLTLVRGSAPPHAAYRMRRKDYFFGTWIKHSTFYPLWFIRLFRHAQVHYSQRLVHEYPEILGTTGALHGNLIHYSFNKGLSEWLAKHNAYSQMEAEEFLRTGTDRRRDLRGLLARDPVRRRLAIKDLGYRLPGRPVMRFVYSYFFRLGILDGGAGLTYCMLLFYYEYLINLKIAELRRRAAGQAL